MEPEMTIHPSMGGGLVWEPPLGVRDHSNIGRYLRWLSERHGRAFAGYDELWRWSVGDLEAFWSSIWTFFRVRAHRPPIRTLDDVRMPGARWFPGAELNYAEHALGRRGDHPAVIAVSETGPSITLTYDDLRRQTAALAAGLRNIGVGRGDRVVAVLPNIPETLVAFLATASLGAIWASCSPEFGARSVIDRFRQIEPRLLVVTDGYRFKGRCYDTLPAAREVAAGLPTLRHVVLVPHQSDPGDPGALPGWRRWGDLLAEKSDLAVTPVPFDHPLWVLYSSGTTGLPKAIVQGHGGILLEHLKVLALHLDLGEDDRFFWYTTTGWMMWNFLIGGLLLGATILLYDGHPAHPDPNALWQLAEDTRMTYFGTSAPYLHACMRGGLAPGRAFDLHRLRGLGSTASPLAPEAFRWVYEKVHPHLLLNPFSGGTDLCTGIVGACPLVPVHAGEIPCRLLGASVEAYDETGRPLLDRTGELVLTRPMPSMPLCFWGDPGGRRYRESYFARFPGVWRHGDWIRLTRKGSCIISGRSDATLNRGGVRMGTSEFYRTVESLPDIVDSLVIDTSELGSDGSLLLFVVPAPGLTLDDPMRARIADALRRDLSPRHVPDEILAVSELPYTLSGKKVEVPVKRMLLGVPLEQAVSRDALRNPDALVYFSELAARTTGRRRPGSATRGDA
jgi:acetoacetyl-CoA synthetase